MAGSFRSIPELPARRTRIIHPIIIMGRIITGLRTAAAAIMEGLMVAVIMAGASAGGIINKG